ncbi:MAG: hypothetical protein IJ906_02940 [Oscillospiraceae bacterium]|nr:hypothetical protein [Oscillospiraceae bacterium]
MTMDDFLAQLDAQLYILTPEERESAVAYYREYLEEAGTNVRAAIAALGSPQSVAQRILREIDENRVVYDGGTSDQYGYADPLMEFKPEKPAQDEGGRLGLTILVIILTFPIWITVFSLWVALATTLAVVPVSLAVAAVAAPIQGIMEIGQNFGRAIWDIGCGVTSAGLFLLLWKPCWLGVKHSTLGLGRLCKKCINGLMGKEKTL